MYGDACVAVLIGLLSPPFVRISPSARTSASSPPGTSTFFFFLAFLFVTSQGLPPVSIATCDKQGDW